MSTVAKKIIQAKTASAEKTIAVCTGNNYLTVVDITDASNMSILGFVNDTNAFDGIGVWGTGDADRDLYFAGNGPNAAATLCVGDYSDPSNPTVLQVFSNAAFSSTIYSATPDTTRELLFLNLKVSDKAVSVDYSDPTALSVLDDIISSTQLDFPNGVAVDSTNEIAYYCNSSDSSVTSVDYSTPSSLSILDEHADSTSFAGASNIKLDSENDILYGVSITRDSIVRFDVSNPSSISTLNYLIDNTNLNLAYDLALDLEDEIALVYSRTNGLSSIDISNSASMTRLDTVDSTSFDNTAQLQIDTARKIAFVKCSNSYSLTSVDYSDASNLIVLDTIVDATKLGGRTLFLK